MGFLVTVDFTRRVSNVLLTETDGSQQPQAVLRWEAGGEQRLEDVVGERQGDHSLVGGIDDQHGDPQPEEPIKQRHTPIKTQTQLKDVTKGIVFLCLVLTPGQ